MLLFIFFFNDTATTEIYTLSLHDALPIFIDNVFYLQVERASFHRITELRPVLTVEYVSYLKTKLALAVEGIDRKSTRLNSSHANISYAVFCLKKKINTTITAISKFVHKPT